MVLHKWVIWARLVANYATAQGGNKGEWSVTPYKNFSTSSHLAVDRNYAGPDLALNLAFSDFE